MCAPHGQKISPAWLEPPTGFRKRKKSTVKIQRDPLLCFLHLTPNFFVVFSSNLFIISIIIQQENRINNDLFLNFKSKSNKWSKIKLEPFTLPLPLYFKSFYLEQISRTLVSKRKLCHFGHSDTTKCILCNVDSSLEHALFSCLFPKYFINALALYLDSIFNHDIPEFIHLKENFYLFNTWYPVFANNEIYFQLSLLILFF